MPSSSKRLRRATSRASSSRERYRSSGRLRKKLERVGNAAVVGDGQPLFRTATHDRVLRRTDCVAWRSYFVDEPRRGPMSRLNGAVIRFRVGLAATLFAHNAGSRHDRRVGHRRLRRTISRSLSWRH